MAIRRVEAVKLEPQRGGQRVTSAVLDRLLHHAETVTVEGNSFRMKDVIDKQSVPAPVSVFTPTSSNRPIYDNFTPAVAPPDSA